MDLSSFEDEKFNVKNWINDVLDFSDASEEKDIKSEASSTVMRLQLAIQEVNGNLEELSSQILATMPRVLRDVETLSQEVALLKNQMANVKGDIENVERNTANSMKTLVELDTIKDRMLLTSNALKEADNWTNLSSEIDEVMDAGDLNVISEKLLALQNCLSILHVPDHEERSAQLEGLKVRFEAMASPSLVQAFLQRDTENSRNYFNMLNSLGRGKNVEGCYQQCEIQQLQKMYAAGIENNLTNLSPNWLTEFYDKISTLLVQQIKWCGHVFDSDAALLLANMCHNLFSALNPSLSHVVTVATKQQESPLTFLQAVKGAGETFLKDYEEALVVSLPEEKESLFILHRRVVQDVYSPIKDQVDNYQDYEESLFLSHLISADIGKKELSDKLEQFRNYCTVINTEIEKAINRCVQLTSGGAFPALVAAVNTYFQNINTRFSSLLNQAERPTESIRDDWSVFNNCLMLMQASGELLLEAEKAEEVLSSNLLSTLPQLKWELDSNPFTVTQDLILSDSMKMQLATMKNILDNDDKLLDSLLTMLQKQCLKCVDLSMNTIIDPVSKLLAQVPNLASWNSSRPSISVTFSPQEYVTEIGQYIMTLPQHLEPLFNLQSSGLNKALQESWNSSSSPLSSRLLSESESSAAVNLITNVGQTVCRIYSDAILRIPNISPNMIPQLTTDIDYVCNILGDLEVLSCEPLSQLNDLLKAPIEEYWDISPGKPPKLIAAVRQMRNIPVKS